MEQEHQTIPRDIDNKEDAVSSPSPSPEATSSARPQTSEAVIEPQAKNVDLHLPDTGGETGVNVNDAQSRATPPINRTNASEFNSTQNTDESGDFSPGQLDHANVVEEDTMSAEGWDPLRSSTKEPSAEKDSRALDLAQTLQMEDESAAQPASQDGFIGVEKDGDVLRVQSPTTATSRPATHLHLNLTSALPSSQAWNNDVPLNSLTQRKLDYPESEAASQRKFPLNSRSLKPKSSYYFGPPPEDSAFGTAPVGQIGVHYPREMVRIERDYSGGELPQFAAIYPLEFEGRISPTQFLESINSINEILISAYSLRHALVDNALAIFSLQLSKLILQTHYDKEMERLHEKIKVLNETLFNPVGLNILWPRKTAFLFLEIEYY